MQRVPAVRGLPPVPARPRIELAEDFEETGWLLAACIRRLERLLTTVRRVDGSFVEPTRLLYAAEITRLVERQERLLRSIHALAAAALDDEAAGVRELIERRRAMRDLVRTEIGLAASFTAAPDWQSPSVVASGVRAAGRHADAITAHHDDYKRDRHRDAADYEAAFLAAHGPSGGDARAILTSCGMSAFSTILAFLALGPAARGSVVMGAHTYHECAALLRATFGRRLVEVDERDPGAFGRAIALNRPRAVFVDTLCNAEGVVVTDLAEVVRALRGGAPTPVHLVIDNTCLSDSFGPFDRASLDANIRLIVYESLTKYAQFGLDAATAGVIVAAGDDADALDDYREHLGTNVGDRAPLLLPPPDRRGLTRRLARIGRNSERLAGALASVAEVAHPSLPGHPSFGVARGLGFRGGLMTVPVAVARQEAVISRAIELAREHAVPLVAGTSFGFDTTRIYAVAADERPFLRIAVGAETISELPALEEVLTLALCGGARGDGEAVSPRCRA